MTLVKSSSAVRRSGLGKARGKGSAHDGAHHWIVQRVTAIALLFLMPWLAYTILQLFAASHHEAQAFFQQPLHAILGCFTLLAMFSHGALGIQVVIEDYITCKCSKLALLIGSKLACYAAAGVGIFYIVTIFLKG